jgi:transposase
LADQQADYTSFISLEIGEKLKGISMFKIKEILRLKYEAGLSNRKIARALHISHSVVNDYIKEFKRTNKRYEKISSFNDSELKALFKANAIKKSKYPIPDFSYVHVQLRNKIVTLDLLHEEYIEGCPNKKGYGYTWFCTHYREYTKKMNPSMRLVHKAGEKIFIDFSGKTVPIVNPSNGVITEAQIFVAVLPASGYPFVVAIPSQKKSDFIEAHCDMFEHFGGVSELLVPDNLKSAVTKADNYDPDVNIDYAAMARYYGCAVMPTRGYRPKDKAKVEQAVKFVQRWILARLRHYTFYTIQELNTEIARLMPLYLDKPIRNLGQTRRELFLKLDKPALLPLPTIRYEHKELKLLKVSKDYHIQLAFNFYSVPYQLIGKRVEVWFSSKTVSITYEGKEVAVHPKLLHKGAYSTQGAHMASSHKKYLEWSPGKIMNWGLSIGEQTAKLFKNIMDSRPHPEMGFRSCLGIISAFKKYQEKGYSEEHLEIIATLAISKHYYRVAQIKELLKSYKPTHSDESASLMALESHSNIRGADYYG